MMRLGNGANIELFVYSGVTQRAPVRPSDYGMQHFAVYVDDIAEAGERFTDSSGFRVR